MYYVKIVLLSPNSIEGASRKIFSHVGCGNEFLNHFESEMVKKLKEHHRIIKSVIE